MFRHTTHCSGYADAVTNGRHTSDSAYSSSASMFFPSSGDRGVRRNGATSPTTNVSMDHPPGLPTGFILFHVHHSTFAGFGDSIGSEGRAGDNSVVS